MSTLALGWVADQGAVRFTVTAVPDDDLTTVKRVNPGGTLAAIRGYPDGTWHGTTGLGYDYEAPMGAVVQYAIVGRDDNNLTGTNLVTTETNLARNPALEIGTLDGWVSGQAASYPLTLDATGAMSEINSAVCTRAGTLTTTVSAVSIYSTGTTRFPVTGGQPFTYSLDVKTEQASRRIRLSLVTYDSTGTLIAEVGAAFVVNDTLAGQVYRATTTITPQANATTAYLSVQVFTMSGNAILGERVWLDHLLIGAPSPYFDGDTPAAGSYTYKWTGTAKASTSQRILTTTVWPVTATIFTATPGRTNGEAWLRDVLQPILSRPVSVVSTGDEVYVARQTVIDVAGKSTPYVVWDSRSARQGTITLAVKNGKARAGVYDDASDRLKLEALFSTGRPLLLSLCASKGFQNGYLAIDSVTFSRIGVQAAWLVQMDYVEVDNPTGLGVEIIPEVTYATAQQLPPSALYSDWAQAPGVTYYDIATRTSL